MDIDEAISLDCAFDELPADHLVRVYGVRYAALESAAGDELYVTRYGWAMLPCIRPEVWYQQRRYAQTGQRLEEGTGAVWRVPTCINRGAPVDLVVKFSRFAQDVPFDLQSTFPSGVEPGEAVRAKFLSPFEEFGLLRELRLGRFGSPEIRIRTKRPLAIFSPAKTVPAWQLGRITSRFRHDAAALERSQAQAPGRHVRLREDRDYLVLFHWVDGHNAHQCFTRGYLDEDELLALTHRVTGELADKGFRVLDNKPQHFILRPRANGALLRRDGQLVYALVDFELLERLPAYEQFLRQRKASRPAEPW